MANNFEGLLGKRLANLTERQLADLIVAIPALSARLLPPYFDDGIRSRFAYFNHLGVPPSSDASIDDLAAFLASDSGITVVLDSLDRLQQAIVFIAAWNGGTATIDHIITETHAPEKLVFDALEGHMSTLLAADTRAKKNKPVFTLHQDVTDIVGFPGVVARHECERYTKAQLLQTLKDLGMPASSSRRSNELFSLLISSLGDREIVEACIATLSQEARSVAQVLLDGRIHNLSEFTSSYYHGIYSRSRGSNSLVDQLAGSGFIGIDSHSQQLWIWLESLVAIRGKLLPEPVDGSASQLHTSPAPVSALANHAPRVDRHLRLLLREWQQTPPLALSDGSLGVKPIRAAAKLLGIPAGQAGMLACIAHDIGLIEPTEVERSGKGRNLTVKHAYTPTPAADEWLASSAAERWNTLVCGWVFSNFVRENGELPERIDVSANRSAVARSLRRSILSRLAELDPGERVDVAEFTQWLTFRFPSMMSTKSALAIIDVLRLLGVIGDDSISLTGPARALLLGQTVSFGGSQVQFVMQADQTVVAPPDLDTDVAIELENYATLESTAGAHIYRIDEELIAKQLSHETTSSEILRFFAEHSSTPVPQNISYLVNDAERKANNVQAGTAQSYIVVNDAALMTRSLAVKPAKLRALAPTVAVSDLPLAQLDAALRKKGVHLPQQTSISSTSTHKTSSATTTKRKSQKILLDEATLKHHAGKIRARHAKGTTKRPAR
jgi:hypothetical protein